jgi:hypothetical protein
MNNTWPSDYGYCDSCTTMYTLYRGASWYLGGRCADLSLSPNFTDPCPGIIRDQPRPDMPAAICTTCQTVYTWAQVEALKIWCGEETASGAHRCPTCQAVAVAYVCGRFPVAEGVAR